MLQVTFWKCKDVDCNVSSHIITMAHQPQASHGGHGGGRSGGRGGRFPRQNESVVSLPCKSGEDEACKDHEQNVFTIVSGKPG